MPSEPNFQLEIQVTNKVPKFTTILIYSHRDVGSLAMRESSDESPEVWQEWILSAIRKIRSQKQRPSIQRICQAIGSHHKFHEDIVAEKLEQAVEAGAVLKVYNKGLHSYKSPSTINKNKTITIDKSSDLSRLVTKAVRVLGECEGSAIKSIENFVQKANNIQVTDDSDYKAIIKNALKTAISKNLLISDGKLYKLHPETSTGSPKKRRNNTTGTPTPRKKKSDKTSSSTPTNADSSSTPASSSHMAAELFGTALTLSNSPSQTSHSAKVRNKCII